MNIVAGTAPFIRSKRKTGNIMFELLIGLMVVFLASVIYYFTLGANYGFKALGMMVVSIVVTYLIDVIVASIRYKKEKDGEFGLYVTKFIKSNFSVVTAVIFTLTLPIGTPWYVLIVGNIFATLIVKHVFGGFGNNIFNPAALARLFVALSFGSSLKAYLGTDLALGRLQAGATVTGQYVASGTKWLVGGLENVNVGMFDLFLGKYSAGLGETFTILILIVGFVLALRRVINWRTPVFMFGTIIISSVFIALIAQINILDYMLLQFGLGGLVFGAIFMFTDPVTSPTSDYGKALIGILAALFNILIRIAGTFPEGTAFSIALVNVFSPMIDKFFSGRTNVKLWKPYVVASSMLVISVGVLSGVSAGILASIEPVPAPIPSFATLNGSYDAEIAIGGGYARNVNAKAKVGLNEFYQIVDLEFETIATSADYMNESQTQILVDYYTSISVAEFKALTAPIPVLDGAGVTTPAQEAEYIIPSRIYSSHAAYMAIDDALKGIKVYAGAHTSLPRENAPEPMTLNVVVYVDETNNLIKTVDIVDGGSTDNWKTKWAEAFPNIVKKYHDLDIATFLAFSDQQQLYGADADTIHVGVTYSPNRLFKAAQKALEGYGV